MALLVSIFFQSSHRTTGSALFLADLMDLFEIQFAKLKQDFLDQIPEKITLDYLFRLWISDQILEDNKDVMDFYSASVKRKSKKKRKNKEVSSAKTSPTLE